MVRRRSDRRCLAFNAESDRSVGCARRGQAEHDGAQDRRDQAAKSRTRPSRRGEMRMGGSEEYGWFAGS